MRDCAVIYDVTDKEKLMLSAVKNFAITLIVSLLVFGTIAFFVAPARDDDGWKKHRKHR